MPITTLELELRGDHIALDALLKATGLAPSGGSARQMITEGLVRVDGQVELRKTAKLRGGPRHRRRIGIKASVPVAPAS
jgi:ribosome-associated protein